MFLSVFDVCCVDCGLCDMLISLSKETYRVCLSNCVYYIGTSKMGQPRPELSCCSAVKKNCL
jgi:hypothetical protein